MIAFIGKSWQNKDRLQISCPWGLHIHAVPRDGVYMQSRRGCVYTPSLGTAYTRRPAQRRLLQCQGNWVSDNYSAICLCAEGKILQAVPLLEGLPVKSFLLILKRMLLFPSEVRVAWVFLGISLGLRPREIPRKTQATPPSEGKSVSFLFKIHYL